eukprot:TRINITY_DN34938_c0_g1_i1.p1 TRINITY_DN34938_c0_g1~~TRINITY_DN34938_c0_g1_i1.p1  ORF type:complete len:442 (+),score=107.71 TRINITY_DN34938_c0_g1_i1:47-1327(+)
MADGGNFWRSSPEKGELNQYWYSQATIDVLVEEVLRHGPRAALVSCPSIYFSLPPAARESCCVLEFDRAWAADPGFVFYDFNDPEAVPAELHKSFDLVVIDPPYITREVWSKYAATARLLLKEGADASGAARGRLLCTSIAENAAMLHELLGIEPRRFRPSIPNLVYQYHTFTNYASPRLDQPNCEVDPDGDVPMPASAGEAAAATAAAWEATYGRASGRIDEIAIQPAAAAAADAVQAAVLLEEAAGQRGEPELEPPSPAAAAILELRSRLGELKKAIGALDAPLQAIVQKADRLAAASAEALPERREALDRALQERASALALLAAAAAAADAAEGQAAEAAPGVHADVCFAEVARSIADAALGIRAEEPRSTRKDVEAFAAANRKHAQAIFRRQTALLARLKELKREALAASAPAPAPVGAAGA